MNDSPIRDVEDLEDRLSTPTPGVIDVLGRLEGDILILGVAGKMGPTLARMVRRASELARDSPTRDRRRPIHESEPGGTSPVAGRRDDRDRPARRSQPGRIARRAERRLHGRPQVRDVGSGGDDLGNEHALAKPGRPQVPPEPDRGLLDGERVRLDPYRRTLTRVRPPCARGRVRDELPGTGADVRTLQPAPTTSRWP